MEFCSEVVNGIRLLDRVLDRLGKLPVFENLDFQPQESSNELCLKLSLVKEGRHPIIDIWISNSDLQINIDRVYEAFACSTAQSTQDGGNCVMHFFELLLTCAIRVRRCGKNYTKIDFLNSEGDSVKSIVCITGIYWKFDCKVEDYSAYYH